MKILFISYHLDPDPVVGAKRMSYWAKNLKKVESEAKVYIITSTSNANIENIDGLHIVKSQRKPLLSYFIKDKGIAWGEAIKAFLKRSDLDSFSHVIISGGPFMQFSLVSFFKKKYSAKVILDYRDPFAINPRFNNGWLKIQLKKRLERQFNKKADLIISVNRYCLALLEGYLKEAEKYIFIPNGFDETLIPKDIAFHKTDNRIRIIYAGSFYVDRSPEKLLNVVANRNDISLIHLGKTSPYLRNAKNVTELGMKTYGEMLKDISEQDAGVIITGGAAFESTTKIYDYMAMKKPILVITSGQKRSGAIGDELQNYPAIWTSNKEYEIAQAIDELKELKDQKEPDVSMYSRKEGLKKLVDTLKSL